MCVSCSHILRFSPVSGMEVVKIGGPVYRIGVGGGAASSVQVKVFTYNHLSDTPVPGCYCFVKSDNLQAGIFVCVCVCGRYRVITPAIVIWVQYKEVMLRWSRR